MKKLKLIFVAIALIASYTLTAQVSINIDGSDADASAGLDVKFSDKGLLPPRVSDVNLINNPAAGLMVYDQSLNCMRYFNGTIWSECMGRPFICGDPIIDARDGQSYNTVLIGTQCWIAENLNIGTMIHSTNGGTNSDGEQTDNGTIEKYCHNDTTDYCETYGGLYQWDELMDYVTSEGVQGICPTGWHVPTDDEWKILEGVVDSQYSYPDPEWDGWGWRGNDAGGNFKETGTILWESPNTGATNSSGFTSLPGGYLSSIGVFYHFSDWAYYWTSSELNVSSIYGRNQRNITAQSYRSYLPKVDGMSLRCLKD